MMPALLGLSGKLQALIDRLTAGRAAAIDNIDAALSTRAPTATALSNATWSSSLATLLAGALKLGRAELIPVTGTTGTGAGRKMADITISAVTLGKTAVFVGGSGRVGAADSRAMAFLTSATNVRLHYVNPNGSNNTYSFQVVVIAFA